MGDGEGGITQTGPNLWRVVCLCCGVVWRVGGSLVHTAERIDRLRNAADGEFFFFLSFFFSFFLFFLLWLPFFIFCFLFFFFGLTTY